jgi:two-component system, OmpR family, response regulator
VKRAIVVDDAKNIRNLLTTCLELYGYEVSAASGGEEALRLFKEESFDLAFLDIKMPEVSGTEVLRRIRASGQTLPVIIMTAFATVKNAVECTKLGAVAYLQKPFTADKVKSVLEEFSLQNSCSERDVEHQLDAARELLEAGKLEEAYCSLKALLSIDPACSKCYRLLGKVLELKGKPEEARRFYKAAELFQ